MAGNPDPHHAAVRLDLILIRTGDPDIRGLYHRSGRDDDGSGLRNHYRSGGDHYRGRLGDHDRTGGDSIVNETSHYAADDSADKRATAVMTMVMVMMVMTHRRRTMTVMMKSSVRPREADSDAERRHDRQHYRFLLVHFAPLPFFAFLAFT